MRDRAVPNLPSRDFDDTEAFYREFGFTVSFRDSRWMILLRGDIQLEFFPYLDLDPTTSSFMCSIRVGDLDELYTMIEGAGVPVADRGIPRLVPTAIQDWGQRVAFLIDRDGTQLSLIEDRG
ncbi:MAG: bleomycin resistance protein [Salinibacterium sp.]|nr:bleomycin resistance protein [Salinibacterium sp.]